MYLRVSLSQLLVRILVDEQVKDLKECKNTKTVYEFHTCRTASIKAIVVKENNKIAPPTWFSTGKMLMLAKLSLMSFIYELCDTFIFPSLRTKAIYEHYFIEYVCVYQILTDADSTSLQFVSFLKDEKSTSRRQI